MTWRNDAEEGPNLGPFFVGRLWNAADRPPFGRLRRGPSFGEQALALGDEAPGQKFLPMDSSWDASSSI